jgi:hypothetical protein
MRRQVTNSIIQTLSSEFIDYSVLILVEEPRSLSYASSDWSTSLQSSSVRSVLILSFHLCLHLSAAYVNFELP